MAKNTGNNYRNGAVRSRSQVQNPKTGNWTKRDADTGRFKDVKSGGDPFKGVCKEKWPRGSGPPWRLNLEPLDSFGLQVRSAYLPVSLPPTGEV